MSESDWWAGQYYEVRKQRDLALVELKASRDKLKALREQIATLIQQWKDDADESEQVGDRDYPQILRGCIVELSSIIEPKP